jgi:predicted nucleic acid-binding protein
LILDTNAICSAADDNPAIASVLSQAGRAYLPVVALGEYRFGIERSRYKQRYKLWLEAFVASCTVLDVMQETSLHYADLVAEVLRIGKPIATNDLWIAALCRQHALPLLSRDHHFDVIPALRRIRW